MCGMKGKEKIVQSIFHRSDVRVGVLSETWLTGKEKPELGRNFDSFISNRAEKSKRGGSAIIVEKTIAEESERCTDPTSFDNINTKNNIDEHQVFKSEIIRETHASAVPGRKILCQRVFKNVNLLKKIFNVKLFDRKKMSKEEFAGKSSFSASTKRLNCQGFLEVARRENGECRLKIPKATQSKVGSWLFYCLRCKLYINPVNMNATPATKLEPLMVPVPEGVGKVTQWSEERTIETGDGGRRHESLLIVSEKSALKMNKIATSKTVYGEDGVKYVETSVKQGVIITDTKTITTWQRAEEDEALGQADPPASDGEGPSEGDGPSDGHRSRGGDTTDTSQESNYPPDTPSNEGDASGETSDTVASDSSGMNIGSEMAAAEGGRNDPVMMLEEAAGSGGQKQTPSLTEKMPASRSPTQRTPGKDGAPPRQKEDGVTGEAKGDARMAKKMINRLLSKPGDSHNSDCKVKSFNFSNLFTY